MIIEDDLVARLRERDSSVYMNGAENWVLAVHPDDPTSPGTLMVNLPWQACKLLREAADEIDRLRDELGVMRARGGDRARLTCPHCADEIEELPVLRCIKCGRVR